MSPLFSCLFGSRLYGTSTPSSDRDLKAVVLPQLDDLLIGKQPKNVFNTTNAGKGGKNTSDDVDEEYIPIQVFAKDFLAGQTYAIELAYAIDGNSAEQTFYSIDDDAQPDVNLRRVPFVQFATQLRRRFLTSNIKAMMGYVVNQASLYSFKGERLNAANEFLEILQSHQVAQTDPALSPSLNIVEGWEFTSYNRFNALETKYPKYFKVTKYEAARGIFKPCFILLEKTFPWTNKLDHSITVAQTLVNKYGNRAKAASADNVDWKATMHAIRIVDEGIAILSGQGLSFPFPSDVVARLLAIKRGEVPIEEIKDELERKLEQLKTLEQTTTLPSADVVREEFNTWFRVWMRSLYLGEPQPMINLQERT